MVLGQLPPRKTASSPKTNPNPNPNPNRGAIFLGGEGGGGGQLSGYQIKYQIYHKQFAKKNSTSKKKSIKILLNKKVTTI